MKLSIPDVALIYRMRWITLSIRGPVYSSTGVEMVRETESGSQEYEENLFTDAEDMYFLSDPLYP